jgi:hypothetical protein
MKDRARLSKRKSYLSSDGANFFGTEDFPKALISTVQTYDPKGQLFGLSDVPTDFSMEEQKQLRSIFDAKIKNKRILLCSGGADKLVPYHAGESFIAFLKTATAGWYKDGNVYVEDIVYPGVGHECTPEMVKDTCRFISDTLVATSAGTGRASKI